MDNCYAQKSEKSKVEHIYNFDKGKTYCGLRDIYAKYKILSGRSICKKCLSIFHKEKE